MNKLSVPALLLAAGLFTSASAQAPKQLAIAQDNKRPAPLSYEFKNLDFGRASSVITLLGGLLPTVHTQLIPDLNTVVLSSNFPSDLEKAEELLRKYDVPRPPQPQVKFTAYLIQGARTGEPRLAESGPMPPELQSVIAEMKRTFAYESYSLVDVVVTDTPAGGGSAEYEGTFLASAPPAGGRGYLDRTPAAKPDFYRLDYRNVRAPGDGKTVNVGEFEFSVKFPYGPAAATPQYGVNRIKSEIAIHSGQKLVLGKLRLRPGVNVDIFLVLTAQVL